MSKKLGIHIGVREVSRSGKDLLDVVLVCVCLLLQYILESCSRWGRGIVEDMCYERRRAEACVD